MTVVSLETYAENTWCPGCGDFGILAAAKAAIQELVREGTPLENIVILSGIGCHGKIVDYINVNSFYSLHGRVLPAATGIKMANPELTVIGFAGDGDAYGEGVEHFVFSAKRNTDIVLVVHNNMVYGLTTGQYTPTSPKGYQGKSTPKGSPEEPMNPIALALASGATFVARGYAANKKHLIWLIKEAVKHRGFALVDVLQPCVTFYNTFPYFSKHVYDLQEEGHDTSDFMAAMEKAREWNHRLEGRVPIGIFYKVEKPTFEEELLKGRRPRQMPYIDTVSHVLKQHI